MSFAAEICPEVRTNYNYYRDYDSTIGRYEQSDPIGLYGGLNTYSYGAANPVARTDPSGRASSIPIIVAVGVGIALCWDFYECAKGPGEYNAAKKECVNECGALDDPRTNIFDYLKCLAKYTPPGYSDNDALSLHYCACAKLGGMAKCNALKKIAGLVPFFPISSKNMSEALGQILKSNRVCEASAREHLQ